MIEQKSIEQVQHILWQLEARVTKLEQDKSTPEKTLESYRKRLEKWKMRLQLQSQNNWNFKVNSTKGRGTKGRGRYV